MKKREPEYYVDLTVPKGTKLIGVCLCNPWAGRHIKPEQSTGTGKRGFFNRTQFSHGGGETKNWKATIYALGKTQYLGSFANIIDAAEAHDNAAFYLNVCYHDDAGAYHSRSKHKLNWPEDYEASDPGAHPAMNTKTRKLVEDYRFAAPFRQTRKRGHRRVIQIWQTSATVRTELDRLTTAVSNMDTDDKAERSRWAERAAYSVAVLKTVGSKGEIFLPPVPPGMEPGVVPCSAEKTSCPPPLPAEDLPDTDRLKPSDFITGDSLPVAGESLLATSDQQPVTSTEPPVTSTEEPADPRDIIIT